MGRVGEALVYIVEERLLLKKLLLVGGICLLSLSGCGEPEQGLQKVRVAVEGTYPPFSYVTPEGELAGFDIDISRALCTQAEFDCNLVAQDWDGMIPGLLARKFDAIIASMSITEERKKRVAFTSKYYATPARFVHAKGSGIELDSEGMAGRTIGVQRATTHDHFLTDNYGDQVQIKRYASQDDAYLDMTAGRLDLLLADAVATKVGFLDKQEGYEFIGPGFTDPKWFGEGAGIAARPGDRALVERFNKAIEAIRTNGVYEQIQSKYFDFNVYGETPLSTVH